MSDRNDADGANENRHTRTAASERTGDAKAEDLRTDRFTEGVNRRSFLNGLAAAGALGSASAGELTGTAAADSTSQSGEWEPKPPQIETPWTDEVGPDNAHPEYPRPQLRRDTWENLNGVWQFAGAAADESPPVDEDLDERVLVPYPIESGLSGIKRHETWMWYRREFEVPNEWLIPTAHPGKGVGNNPNAQRLLIHFERVDWEATVHVNGEEVTTHRGGYDHFVADVTEHLTDDGPQELVVGVYDPTGVNTEPIGTQPKGRQGVGTGFEGEDTLEMTPSSGIWDTVWLEPVPDPYIANLEMTPDLDAEALRLTVDATTADGEVDDAIVVATAYDDAEEKVGRVTGSPGEELELPVSDPHLWSPEDPYLYDLEIELRRKRGSGNAASAGGGKPLDSVESYFGMRSLGKREVAGTARPTLNGEPVWHLGSLESGQWPDGLYTAPTDEALRANLAFQKELGYNMVRKHVKVEPRRWFYHADRLGLLVWQDMPNMHEAFDTPPRDEDVLEQFESELREVVTEHDTHPSMAVWIPINEGWGINNDNVDFVRELTETVSDLDPERLVDAHSGYDVGTNRDPEVGDFKDVHQYGTPWYQIPQPEPDRISALGEYTSPSLSLEDHTWGECGSEASVETYLDEYVDRVEALSDFMVGGRLSASVYTATTDLENVCNGMISYDRKVLKPTETESGLERVRETHESLIEQSRRVMGNLVIDVETPPSYISGGLLGSAQSFEVTVTVSNPESPEGDAATVENVSTSISGGLPDDWTVESTGESFDAIADGESATATWTVTPDSVADGDVTFDVTVAYEIDGEQDEYNESRAVSAAQLAYWRFENDPEDDSSYDATLSLRNGASFDDEVAVQGDYSMRLDGEDDFAQISGFDSGILHDAFTERTVSMWIRPDSTSGDQVLYNEGGTISGAGLRINDGTLEAIVARNQSTVTVSTAFDRTEWTHVAFVFDRGALRLYVNGEEVAVTEDAGFDIVPSHVAGSELGANTTTSPWGEEDRFFGGHLDATAIYNRALGDDDVEAIATRSFAVDAPALYAAGSDPDPFTVSATFSDLGADDGDTYENLAMEVVDLPDGWSASAATETTFDTVPDGGSVTASWDVTPAPNADGAAELEAAVDYEADGDQRRLTNGTRLDTLTSAALAEWRFNWDTTDHSGNGHAAVLEGGASFDDETAVEGSHSVDLTGDGDRVDLAEGGEEFLSRAFSARSVSVWFRPQSTDGNQVIYNQGAAANGMAIRISEGTLQVTTIGDGTNAVVENPFTGTEWTHVAAVFDHGALRLYVNGEEVAANEDVGFETVGSGYWGGELGGADTFPWDGDFDGHVDVSAIYPFALTPEQISTLAGSY